ncbi:accessory factor UbiK family protein [Thiobacillus sp.]|uniref:accessory factor UbiK family protein n=1 Tax=Thiobacillus sp. TaxID=924 RepID=UPI0025FCA0FF|nr:accessory factor UbiK family protein [Thiobacillus sp.]
MVRHQIVMHPLRAACFDLLLLYATRAVLVTLSLSWRPYEPESEIPHPCIHQRSGRQAGRGHEAIPAKDIEQNLKAGVTSMLGKLDMVSREEFDVQTEVLARTRAKLAQLEARLTELEKQQSQDA